MKRNNRILVRIVNACRDVRRASLIMVSDAAKETHAVRLYKEIENQPYPLKGAAVFVLLFTCISLLGLSSCNDTDYVNASDQVAVVFAPEIEGTTARSSEPGSPASGSRAVDQTWSASDKVGIAMVANGTSLPTGATFSQYQVSGAGASVGLSPVTVDQTLFYPTDGSDVSFVAFSPYTDVVNSTITYTTFASQSTQADIEKVDFLYHKGTTAYNKTSSSATLAFGHKLSKIIINATTSSNDIDKVTLSSLNMAINGTPGSVTANLTDGSLTTGANATITPCHTDADADTRMATAILVPHAAKSGRTITFTADEGNYTYTFANDDFAFESNKVYTMNFKMTKRGVTLTDVTIDNWSTGTIDWTGKYMFELLNDNIAFTVAANTTTTMIFNSNSGTAPAVVLSTSDTDPNAGTPDWVTGVLTTSTKTDYTQYTYKFNVTTNTDAYAREAYAHILNGTTSLGVVPVKQKGIYENPNNSYIVKPGNKVIYIPVSRVNEHVDWIAAAGVTDDTATPIGDDDVLTAAILWSTAFRLVTLETYGTGASGAIKVTTTETEGNAVVAVKVNGVIKWSWHIWVTYYEPTPIGELGWMDRNLGAFSNSKSTVEAERVKTHGLLYQWGRKDPFPGSVDDTSYIGTEPTLYGASTGTLYDSGTYFTYSMSEGVVSALGAATLIKSEQSISYTVANPMTFIASSSSWQNSPASSINNNNWGAQGGKGLYDPCPEGYRVPKNGSWGDTSWVSTYPWQNDYNGCDAFPYGGWYPAAGLRESAMCSLSNQGSKAMVWSADAAHIGNGYLLYINSSNIYPKYNEYRSSGCSIRCISE